MHYSSKLKPEAAKQSQSADIQAKTNQFMALGGKISQIPRGISGDKKFVPLSVLREAK